MAKKPSGISRRSMLTGAAIVVTFNLIVDILYAWIDPRIRYG